MNVLVTGAAGFLGRRVARRLLAGGHAVRAFVRPGSRFDLAGAVRVEGDLAGPGEVEAAVTAADAVVHCGARVQTTGAWAEFDAVNVGATRRILGAAGGRPVVHVSSLGVYEVRRDGDLITEDSPYEAGAGDRGFYSRSKLEADRLAMEAAASGVGITVVRPGVLYGPGRRPPIARQSFALGPLRLILGSDDYLLPLAHGDNVADAIALALESPRARGRAYTLVDPQIPLRQYLGLYRSAAGASWNPVFIPATLTLPAAALATALFRLLGRRSPVTTHQIRRATDSARYDCSRAERELGWKPAVSLAAGLRESFAPAVAAAGPLVSKTVSE